MTAQRLEGRPVADAIKAEVAARSAALQAARGHPPSLVIVQAGADPATAAYTRSIIKQAGTVGVTGRAVELPATVSIETVLATIHALNTDPTVDGILVQLPLPPHLDVQMVAAAIAPEKDVEGMSPVNAGRLLLGQPGFVPNTPLGGLALLDHYQIPLVGTEAVIVGRSAIVGKPMALLLLQRHATVTLCHTRTRDLGAVTRRADLLVAAAGKAGLITAAMIKPGATVIDFGTNETPDGLVGDVDYAGALAVAGAVTPVPGGTGPVTVAALLRSVLQAAEGRARPA